MHFEKNGHAVYDAMRNSVQTTYQVGGGDTAPADASAPESQGSCFQPKSLAKLCSQTIIEGRAALSFSTNGPKCDINWKLYEPHHHRPTESNVYIQRPTYKKNINKKRFFIFVAGPPGSGKSTIALSMQRNATAINPEAAGFLSRESYDFIRNISSARFKKHGWITLGHDQEISEDPRYNLFCRDLRSNQPHLSMSKTPAPSIEEFLNPSSPWVKKMKEDQHTYNQLRYGAADVGGEEAAAEGDDKCVPCTCRSMSSMKKREAATKWFNENLSDVIKKNRPQPLNSKFDRFSISTSMLAAINYWNNGVDSPRNLTRAWADGEGYRGTDIMLYTKLLYMIQNGVNIVYETTFQKPETLYYIFQQISLLTNNCEDYQYIIMLGFPIVNILTLQQRILHRFMKTRNDDCSEKSKGKSEYRGLQGIDFQSLACQMQLSYENLITYINECGRQSADKDCHGIGIDILYIYNNNKDNAPEELWDTVRLSRRSYSIRGYQDKATNNTPKNPDLSIIIEQLEASLRCIRLAYRGQASLLRDQNRSDQKVYDATSWVKKRAGIIRNEQQLRKCSKLVSLPDPNKAMADYSADLLMSSQDSAVQERQERQEREEGQGGGARSKSRRRRTRRHKRKGKKGRRRTRRQGSS